MNVLLVLPVWVTMGLVGVLLLRLEWYLTFKEFRAGGSLWWSYLGPLMLIVSILVFTIGLSGVGAVKWFEWWPKDQEGNPVLPWHVGGNW